MAAPPETGEATEVVETPVKCVCGRLLTDPVSRTRGLGPRCHKRLSAPARPRARIVGTYTAACHPRALPGPPVQLALDWDDEDDQPDRPRPITDVPTGAFL